MPLLTSVLRKMGVSQPFQRFIDELLLLLLIVPLTPITFHIEYGF